MERAGEFVRLLIDRNWGAADVPEPILPTQYRRWLGRFGRGDGRDWRFASSIERASDFGVMLRPTTLPGVRYAAGRLLPNAPVVGMYDRNVCALSDWWAVAGAALEQQDEMAAGDHPYSYADVFLLGLELISPSALSEVPPQSLGIPPELHWVHQARGVRKVRKISGFQRAV